jgi:FixJ family two-component response regulator
MYIPFHVPDELLTRLQKCRLLDLQLTKAERSILKLAFEDLTARQIAIQLRKSVHTIETHLKKIRTKAAEIYVPRNVSKSFVIAEMKLYYFIPCQLKSTD